jgi:CheY-like chemotaxis protein
MVRIAALRHARQVHVVTTPSERRLRVLLVDDSSDFRAAAREYLQGVSGAQLVGEAADGCEALSQSERLQPDLVLMDLRMPRANGIEATPRIKALPCHPVVVLFTVHTSEPLRQAARAAGADALFSKDEFVKHAAATIRCLVLRQAQKPEPGSAR